MPVRGLVERLRNGENIVIGEGYLLELERRGYLKSGVYTPEVVLDHPERVYGLHEEFVHAGSDVVEAFTYYGHREKMRVIGREDELEALNLRALKMAREVADATGTLMAGNICNTNIFDPDNPETAEKVKSMFKEQVEWAVRGGADYFIGETFNDYGEAKLALEAVQKYGKGMPAVITLAAYCYDITTDDIPIPKALKMLEDAGAAVVGLNCGRGPRSMLPLLKEARKACKGPLAALPVTFRTTECCKTMHTLIDPETGKRAFPLDLAPFECSRSDIRQFAQEAKEIGVQYIGLCCGSSPYLLREVAEVYGRKPESSKYSPAVHKSVFSTPEPNSRRQKVRDFMAWNYVAKS